jgi:rod shape-determining protein MreC
MDKNRQGATASYVVLVICAVLWMVLPSAVHRFNQEAFAEFQAPALHLAAKGRDLARYWELKSRDKEEILAASRDLARANAALELQLRRYEDVRKENVRLREMLRYSPPTEFLTVVARVGSRDASTWWQRIVIRKGSDDGVRAGCPVVFSDRIIGKVAVAHHTTSEVDLITSANFRCTAFLEGDEGNRTVLVTGLPGPLLTQGRARVSAIPQDYFHPVGTAPKVVTTGLGGVYPAGLVLGTMEGTERPTQDGNFKEAYITPTRDLFSLQEVTVLVPKYPSAGEVLLEDQARKRLDELR